MGFPGGSSPDLVARTLAEPLSKALGQPVIVENKPGASGNIAADQVAKSTDNHTLGLMINGNLTTAKLLNPQNPYDPAKDLMPISLIATAPLVLVAPVAGNAVAASGQAVNSAVSPSAGREFLAAAKRAGSSWSYGSPGVGTVAHIAMEMLNGRTGAGSVHVPYPGNPQVVTALLGQQIQLALLPPGLAMAQMRSGKLQALAVTSSGRSPVVPELPSLAELGVKDFQFEIWDAVAAPASFPKPIAARLSALLSEIARSPDVRQKLATQGWQVAGTSAEGLAIRMKNDTAQMAAVIAKAGIKIE